MVDEVSWRLRVVVWAVGFALVAGPGLAATTSSCTPFLPEMIPGVRLRFPYEPFDPQLGTLNEVAVTVQGSLFGKALISAVEGGPAYAFAITHELATDLGRSFTFLGGEVARFEFSGQSAPLLPIDYSRDFTYRFRCDAASNGDGFCPLVGTQTGVDNPLTGMSASLVGFIDDGLPTAWQVFVNTNFEASESEIPFATSPDLIFGAEGETCVDYLYTVPEPAVSLGFLAAMLTLGGISRVREFLTFGEHSRPEHESD